MALDDQPFSAGFCRNILWLNVIIFCEFVFCKLFLFTVSFYRFLASVSAENFHFGFVASYNFYFTLTLDVL